MADKRLAVRILLLVVAGCSMFFSIAEAEEIRYDKGERRDPFIPLMGLQADQERGSLRGDTLAVEGIVFDPKGSSYAVIGGEIYREGENIEGTKLLKILPDRVIFFQGGQEVVIWLHQEIVRGKQREGE